VSERIQNVQPREYKGRTYRSTLEAETAKTLDAMGISFEYESRKIILQEGFRCPYQKDKVRDLTYTPDFIIGQIMLECKGFETPEWKIKKKLLFKWLTENDPDIIFYQIHDNRKELLKALDPHWWYLGFCLKVTSKGTKKHPSETQTFDSIAQAMEELNLRGKAIGPILRSLTGKTSFVYGYQWRLEKLKL
jgi:hypothetical protein